MTLVANNELRHAGAMSRRDDAKERLRREREELEMRKKAERQARREAHKQASLAGASAAAERRALTAPSPTPDLQQTFGEMLAATGLLKNSSVATRQLNDIHAREIANYARAKLKVISCTNCTAPKGCCRISVGIQLYEAVPIAARLIDEGRDTPELRARLEAAATSMEMTSRSDYDAACVFLDSADRCTIYEDRPSECGKHFVFSDPALCSSSDPDARVEGVLPPPELAVRPFELEKRFSRDARLHTSDQPYHGALPRMVLVCLEAWNRRDYVEFLAAKVPKLSRRFDIAIGGGPRAFT